MSVLNHFLKNILTAFAAIVMFSIPAKAVEQVRLDRLFAQLNQVEAAEARKIGNEIVLELSKSGSAAMDLLLKRGQDSMEAGDTKAAIEHFTALTDHAPEFSEGWHMRAVAYTRAGLLGPAIADLEQALTLRPRHFQAIFDLGVILEGLNRPAMAQDAYARVQAIHPHHQDLADAQARVDGVLGGQNL